MHDDLVRGQQCSAKHKLASASMLPGEADVISQRHGYAAGAKINSSSLDPSDSNTNRHVCHCMPHVTAACLPAAGFR